MKTVLLAKGEYEAIVDDADYEEVRRHKWWLLRTKAGKLYAYRPYRKPDGKYSTILMHRQITGASPALHVDHINGNGLDNRRSNLRECTQSQNSANKPKAKGLTSKFKGVSWNKRRGCWQAFVKHEGKSEFIGYYGDEAAAAKAYDKRAVEIFKEFARPNFTENR